MSAADVKPVDPDTRIGTVPFDTVTKGVSRATDVEFKVFGVAMPWIPHQSIAHGMVSALSVVPILQAFAIPRPPAVVIPPVVADELSVALANAAPVLE